MPRRHPVPLADLEREGRALVVVGGRVLAVFASDGAVFALENACPHAGNPLVDGEVAGRALTCVYHGWRFDLETGACLFGDAPARTYPVDVRDGEAWIDVGF